MCNNSNKNIINSITTEMKPIFFQDIGSKCLAEECFSFQQKSVSLFSSFHKQTSLTKARIGNKGKRSSSWLWNKSAAQARNRTANFLAHVLFILSIVKNSTKFIKSTSTTRISICRVTIRKLCMYSFFLMLATYSKWKKEMLSICLKLESWLCIIWSTVLRALSWFDERSHP